MTKCASCGFDNEDGALFCEQCKSDLAAAPAIPAAIVEPVAEVIPEAVPEAEAVPMAIMEPAGGAAPVVDPPPAAEPAVTAPAAAPAKIPAGAQPRLKVMRGLKVGVEFPVYGGHNFIGRADEKPVDIDLEDQEPADRVWCSRQHAVIDFNEAEGIIVVEDLNSSNGTFVNRTRVYPGEKRGLNPNDVVQIGTVHMKLLV